MELFGDAFLFAFDATIRELEVLVDALCA